MMTTNNLANWFELLELSCAHVGATCLDIIVDQVGSSVPLLANVRGVEPALLWCSLFTGLPEAPDEDLAPLLVRIDLTSALQRQLLISLIHAIGTDARLLLLASPWEFSRLAEHLSACLDARNGGRRGILRYYDPHLFPLLLNQVLQAQQQAAWLRPAFFWSWLDRDGTPCQLIGLANASEDDAAESIWPIELSDRQIDLLCSASDTQQLIPALARHFSAQWSAEECFGRCYSALLEANEAGLLGRAQWQPFIVERLGTP